MSVNPIASSLISVPLAASTPLEAAGAPSAPSRALPIDAAHAPNDFRSQSSRLSARISELERALIGIDRRTDELESEISAGIDALDDGARRLAEQQRSDLQERRAAIGAELAAATARLSALTSGAKDSEPLDARRAAELLRVELFRGR